MKNTVSALALLSAVVAASSAYAQDMSSTPQGLYLGLGADYSMPRDTNISGTGIDVNRDLKNTVGGMAALGWSYGNNWRTEAELQYRSNDAKPSGDATVWNTMVNGYYDFNNIGLGRFAPYLGAGVGAAHVDFGNVPAGTSTLDDKDWVFAYQGIAGVGYQLTDQLNLFADYRYLGSLDGSYNLANGTSVDAGYNEHQVMVGLRWNFWAPSKPSPAPMPVAAPAPAPAPAVQAPPPPPPPARNYLVFFDFDKADLKSDAKAIVGQAAQAFPKSQGVTRIQATGHADRAGSDTYNMRLSQRRAQAVKDELVKQGVPANVISVIAKGEREPLVPTADGVREPQNRRVEIVLQ